MTSERNDLEALASRVEDLAFVPGHKIARDNIARDLWNLARRLQPARVPEGYVLVRESMLRHWLRELNAIRNGSVNATHSAEHVHASITSVLAAAPAPEAETAKGDVYEAYKTWPDDIRAKLSVHDLRRMSGWAPRTHVGDWRIDTSAGGPILVYQNCSVIESETARYVLRLIERDLAEGAAVNQSLTTDEKAVVKLWCETCHGSGALFNGENALAREPDDSRPPCADCDGKGYRCAHPAPEPTDAERYGVHEIHDLSKWIEAPFAVARHRDDVLVAHCTHRDSAEQIVDALNRQPAAVKQGEGREGVEADIASLIQDATGCADSDSVYAAMAVIRRLSTAQQAGSADRSGDTERLDFIERTFSGMTDSERYLPVRMRWGKGCNGRTLREACDKYMAREKVQRTGSRGEVGE